MHPIDARDLPALVESATAVYIEGFDLVTGATAALDGTVHATSEHLPAGQWFAPDAWLMVEVEK
jgi:hypothetical protein